MPVDAPTPPVDQSVGIMYLRYLLGDLLIFVQRIHLDTIDPTGVLARFATFTDKAKKFYDSAWTIQLASLDKVLGGIVTATRTPVTTDVSCDGTTPTTGIAGLTETIFEFDTDVGTEAESQKGRFRFVGIGGSAPGRQVKVSDSAGGTAHDQDFVGMVTDPASGIVARNGAALLAPATKNTPLAKDYRRKSMRRR